MIRLGLAALLAFAAAAPARAEQPLSGAEARSLLAGNSTRGTIVLESPLLGHVYERWFAADGQLVSRNVTKGTTDSGTWRVDDAGNICMTHRTWASGREYCTAVASTADGYERLFKGKPSETVVVYPGDAFGLGR